MQYLERLVGAPNFICVVGPVPSPPRSEPATRAGAVITMGGSPAFFTYICGM